MSIIEWDEALAAMGERERAAAIALRDRFAELGEREPESAALSEITEDVPQFARFLAIRRMWPDLIDGWAEPGTLESVPAARRLLGAGADRDDLVRVARSAAYDAVFGVLYRLTAEGRDGEAPAGAPGWRLVETTAEGEPTGRTVGSLHEDVLAADPSGLDGRDLLD